MDVNRHIIFPLTLLLLEKLMVISPDNTCVPMSKQVNRVNIEPEIAWKLVFLLEV